MTHKIVFVACEPTLAVNSIAIASAFRSIHPGYENILVDPRKVLWPEYTAPSPSYEFSHAGFYGEIIESEEFPEVFRYDFPTRAYLFYRLLFERIKPSVIVVMHEYGYSFYAVQAAKLFGIPTYHVQHGIYEPDRFAFDPALVDRTKPSLGNSLSCLRRYGCDLARIPGIMLRKMSRRGCPDELAPFRDRLQVQTSERYPIHADRIGVWSGYYKRLLTLQRPEFGGDRIDVIGFPHGDTFFGAAKKSPEETYAEFGFPISGRLAICLYCPFHEIPGNVIHVHPEEALMEAIASLRSIDPHLNILILAHPNYNLARQVERLKILVADFVNVAIRENSSDFLALCNVAAVVFGVKSSLFYIAMLANVPIVIQAYVLEALVDYQAIEGCGAIPVFYRITLSQQLERALNDSTFLEMLQENQKRLCEDLLGPFNGKSGLRTVIAINDLIRLKGKTFPKQACYA